MTRRTTLLATACVFATTTLLAGVVAVPSAMATGTSAAAPTTDQQQSAQTLGVRQAAERAATKGIDWKDCPSGWGLKAHVQCGWVTVPVDYAQPDGPTIDLAVSQARSTGTRGERQGSLVYNPGGPGGSGLRFPLRGAGKDPAWAKAAEAYDFVGFDPRGVGHSAPISCMDPQEFVTGPKPDPVPYDEAGKLARRKLAEEYAQGCQERGGDLVPHMTTPKHRARPGRHPGCPRR